MNRYSKLFLAAAVAITTAAGVAYAAQGGMDTEATAITKAKISLVQAITTAEQHANGKATHAEFEHSRHGWIYEVEVASAAKVFDVKVDADKGTVISSVEDKPDLDDDLND